MINQDHNFTFKNVLERILDHKTDDDPGFITMENLNQVWIAFFNHVKEEIGENRRIKVESMFIVGTEENSARLQLEFTKNYLKREKMVQKLQEKPPIIPIRKLFTENLTKFTSLNNEETKELFQVILSTIKKLISENQNMLELELKFFGKLIKLNNSIQFLNCVQEKQPQKGFRVKDLIRIQQITNQPLNFSLGANDSQKQNKMQTLVPLKSLMIQNQDHNTGSLEAQKKPILKPVMLKRTHDAKTQNKVSFATHPLSLNQKFSEMIQDPLELFQSTFKLPPKIKQPAPIIFSLYSQTKSCPLNLQYNSLSVSSRIAINYTPLSKYLYLDETKKKIKILHNKENNALFLRQAEDQQDEGSSEEVAKKRYYQYIKTILIDSDVIEFPESSIEKIMQLQNKDFKFLNQDMIQELSEFLIKEIKMDFKFAAKKALLDYILKNPQEKLRLGIDKSIEPVVEYGMGKYNFKLREVGDSFANKRSNLEKQLIVLSPTTNKIMKCWIQFENENCFVIDSLRNQHLSLEEFTSTQYNQQQLVRGKIGNEWIKKIMDIYKNYQVNKTKEEMKKYFKCIRGLIQQQARNLLVQSIDSYVKLFRKYKQEKYKTIQECLLTSSQATAKLEKSFLILKIKEENNNIIFEKPVDQIKEELLRLLKDCVTAWQNIPCPDNHFIRTEISVLQILSVDDEIVENALSEISLILDQNFQKMENIQDTFKNYLYLFEEEDKLQKLLDVENVTKDKLMEYNQKYEDLEKEIVYKVPQNIHMSLAIIDCTSLKNRFKEITIKLRENIMKKVNAQIMFLIDQIGKNIKSSMSQINQQCETVQKLIKAEEHLDFYQKKTFFQITNDFELIVDWYADFFIDGEKINKDLLNEIYLTKTKILNTEQEIQKERTRIKGDRQKLEKQNLEAKDNIQSMLKTFEQKIEDFKGVGRKFLMTQQLPDIQKLIMKYESGQKSVQIINEDEKLLGLGKSEFQTFKEAGKNLNLFSDLWQMVDLWDKNKKSWENKNIFQLDIQSIDEDLSQKIKSLNIIIQELSQMDLKAPSPLQIAEEQQKSIRSYKEDLVLLKALCQTGIKERHWVQINNLLVEKQISLNLNANTPMYIKMLKDSGIKNYLQELQEISEIAAKEYQNEKSLDKIEEEWDKKKVELVPYRVPETAILTMQEVDDVQALLEEHLIKIQTMKGSQFAKVYKPRIEMLENKLTLLEKTFDCWLKVQSLWIYLEPIFNSEDIMRSLPEEGSKFKAVNEQFLSFMLQRQENPEIIEIASEEITFENLNKMRTTLEHIDKNLENYLDTKRQQFPRFYFLSSESLIDILSQSKEPTKIQKYVKILFEGIQSLIFNDNEEIEGMVSSEGEVVMFEQKIVPKYYKGLVERWLTYLEETMIYEVKKFILQSFNEYANMSKDNFVLNRPGQALVNVFMTFWTFETENTITENGVEGLREYHNDQVLLIEQLIQLFDKDITPVDRCGLETCIVISVHNRDIIQELISQEVDSIENFNYQSNMRYYWDNSDNKEEIDNNPASVKIMNTTHSYNYEYLGNSPRLVITPLTDRCYRTLCSAVFLYYGGAPEGPAGTGKTETVKDLAKALARMIVVFNCSDKMDYKSMERFLKGLVCSGGWSCFDEFNRIELEVLSVIAQQLQKISTALSEKKTEFMFEGSLIKIKPTCNCFITMNPGYAGRSELPDNLKALFRSVAMMVPNYALIAEIRLFSFGFKLAPSLANKIVTTYKLCSEQISPQKHYDYGMRAVNSTLSAAGNFKKKSPDEDEELQILKAIHQVNVAKFLSEDLPLFFQITQDLFPQIKHQKEANEEFMGKLETECKNKNLQFTDYFSKKIIQLNETLVVRHGVMLVGQTYGGKTSALEILQKALQNITKLVLNPKALQGIHLYGFTDPVSQEWTDGVLTILFKTLALDENLKGGKWLVFDGPVDAVWVENLNTVLDDNKKLCLSNGDVFYLAPEMNMIFEVEDLQEASPATVSRCGMVYFEPEQLGWKTLIGSWKNTLPHTFKDFDVEKIDSFILTIIEPLVNHVFSGALKFIQPCLPQQMIHDALIIADSLLAVFNDKEIYNNVNYKERFPMVDQILLYALINACGNIIKEESRKFLEQNIRMIIQSCDKSIQGEARDLHRKVRVPDSGNLLDYKLTIVEKQSPDGKSVFEKWVKWSSFLQLKESIPDDIPLKDLFIETQDTVKYRFCLGFFLERKLNVLVCGSSGTGKTQLVNKILKTLDPSLNICNKFCFSGQTNVFQVQQSIEAKLNKRVGKHRFGPPKGQRMIIFIDDLNMPKKQIYGAQPSIEFLRQFIEQKGFFNLVDKSKFFMNVEEVNILGAMTIHNSSNQLPQRFLRHMNIIPFAESDKDQLFKIYNTILNWHFQGFNEQIVIGINKLTHYLLQTYHEIKQNFLPLPSKIHYMFNLRDISKVIKGVCMSRKEEFQSQEQIFKLTVHEIWRVFGDKLNSFEDREVLINKIIKPTFNQILQKNFDIVFQNLDIDKNNQVNTLKEFRELIFTNMLKKEAYSEVLDKQKLGDIMKKSLQLLNDDSEKPLSIVLFSYAIEHLLIIYRILQQESNHGLLLGMGGSGRTSLTKLAVFIAGQEFFQLSIGEFYEKEEWQEDIKKILKIAGKQKEVTFYFSENQIKEDYFIEDINNLLNNGEIPNLFNPEDKGQISEIVGEVENQDVMEVFNDRVKKYLHIVLSFSEIGQNFKQMVKTFPSIVNFCCLDWFSEWPQDALTSVGQFYISNMQLEEEVKVCSVEVMKKIHYSAQEQSLQFKRKLGRTNYVTGSSYLELLTQFIKLYQRKNKEIIGKMNTYLNGYDMILESERIVEEMKEKLNALLPDLEKANKETEQVMIEVKEKKQKADEMQEVLSKEEENVRIKANKAKEISDECQKEIDKIQPELDKALIVVKNIKKQDFDDLRGYNVAPLPIKYALQCLCLILAAKPVMVKDPKTFRQVPDWWQTSKKLLRDLDVKALLEFDNEKQMDDSKFKKINELFENPETKEYLEESAIRYSSEVAAGMFLWIVGQKNLFLVNKDLKPRKIALDEANAELEAVNAVLAQKQELLDHENKKVSKLNDQLLIIIKKKQSLEKEYNTCLVQTERARKLIDNLADEKDRWRDLAAELKKDVSDIVGSVILSAGYVAYAGPFTSAFRNEMLYSWTGIVKETNMMKQETEFNFNKYIGNQITIRDWTMKGLPQDSFSISNAVIMENSDSYPLFIDPQFQANKFIKNFYKNSQLEILNPSRKDLLKVLENGLQYGLPVLIENVQESISSSFDTILKKQTLKQGTGMVIKMGDKFIDFNKDFTFMMTTKLSNPHFSPDITTKTKILNFMITQQGLKDQILSLLVIKEKPFLEEQREKVLLEGFNNKKQLDELEQQILEILSLEKKKLLEDETAVNVLAASKQTSKKVIIKQKIAEETEANIQLARQNYEEISAKMAKLFFAVNDLSKIDRMYEYSLEYYLKQIEESISESEKTSMEEQRILNIFEFFQFQLYKKIQRSIFVKDKLLFSFLMMKRLKELEEDSELTPHLFKFFLTGVLQTPSNDRPKPQADWISQKSWLEILQLSLIDPFFKALPTHVEQNLLDWKNLAEDNPMSIKIPLEFRTGITDFQKLVLIKCFKPESVVQLLRKYVVNNLGEKFVSPPSIDMNKIYLEETDCRTPIIFLLTPGVDPYSNLKKLEKIYDIQMDNISLGQGQGPIAKRLIKSAYENGNWVVLQNCHLAVKFMKELEKECEFIGNKQNEIHEKFRIWLTTYPSEEFPLSILQNSLKITNEPPKGLKNNIISCLNIDLFKEEGYFIIEQKQNLLKLVYSLCFFHAFIQERKNYGPLGWNIPYEFTESDLTISGKQLQVFLTSYSKEVPLDALNYIIAECNYGGRVTDDKDRRLIKTLMAQFFCKQLFETEKFQIDYLCKDYFIPDFKNFNQLLHLSDGLPEQSPPQIVGLHPNAQITKEINESNEFINTLIKTQEGKSTEQEDNINTSLSLIQNLIKQIPQKFDIKLVKEKYPIKREQSMNTVLQQDTEKFNRLLQVIATSLSDINQALQGQKIFTTQLEEVLSMIDMGRVPQLWLKYSYPSLKPLSSYINDLIKRVDYFQNWIKNEKPKDNNISAFFFTQGFLTSTIQNYSRKYLIPIDKVSFKVNVVKNDFVVAEESMDFVYIYGMFLEGASFDYDEHVLAESNPRVLYQENFRLKLSPYNTQKVNDDVSEENEASTIEYYDCPLYRTLERRGELLTTGHSTNFVTFMQLPTDLDPSKWIKRGVALILELNY